LQREWALKQLIAQIGAGIEASKDQPTGDDAVFTDSLCSSVSSSPETMPEQPTDGIVRAALELAVFSALEQQEQEQQQHPPPHQASKGQELAGADVGCNCTLRRQLADIEVDIQELLLKLGCRTRPDELYITTCCLRQLSPARMQQLVQRTLQQCLQESARTVGAMMCCLPG
jgi:hypothetical protein